LRGLNWNCLLTTDVAPYCCARAFSLVASLHHAAHDLYSVLPLWIHRFVNLNRASVICVNVRTAVQFQEDCLFGHLLAVNRQHQTLLECVLLVTTTRGHLDPPGTGRLVTSPHTAALLCESRTCEISLNALAVCGGPCKKLFEPTRVAVH